MCCEPHLAPLALNIEPIYNQRPSHRPTHPRACLPKIVPSGAIDASRSEISIEGDATFANNKAGGNGGGKGCGMDIVGNEVHVTTGVVALTCRKTALSER